MSRLSRLVRNAMVVVIAIVMVVSLPVQALDGGYDPDFFSANDIVIYDPRATTCGIDSFSAIGEGDFKSINVSKDFTLGTENGKRAVNLANQMKADFSLTDAQAAGIVGNFMWESGGSHLPPNINEGGTAGPPKFHGGYGWAQWTGGRQTQFIKFAISKGYMTSKSDEANDAANYAFLKYELIMTERSTLPAVGKTSTAADAARAFEANFERAGKPVLDERIKRANQLFNALKNGTDVDTSAPDATDQTDAVCDVGTGIPAGGKVFDTVVFPLTVKQSQVRNKNIFKNSTTQRAGHPYIAFDILAAAGTEVVALTGGKVTDVNLDGSLGGNITIYNEEKKLHIFYTHMTPKRSIKKNDTIAIGQPLGALLSVKKKPAINADHLHIDAGTGRVREGCSRSNPSGAACKTRVDIGPDLYNAWEKLSP